MKMISLKEIVALIRRRDRTEGRFIRLARLCESPIEEAFWAAAYPKLSRLGKFAPQVKVSPYRLDFSLVGNGYKIAVECDGYKCHSTPDAISADNARDIALQADGWRVVRFLGRDIYRDVGGCVEAVVGLARAIR